MFLERRRELWRVRAFRMSEGLVALEGAREDGSGASSSEGIIGVLLSTTCGGGSDCFLSNSSMSCISCLVAMTTTN